MTRLASFALALSLFAAGCVSSGETAIVTQRPTMVVPDSVNAASAQVASTSAPAASSSMATPYDTVQARRFDSGKMWTFDNPPLDYFAEAYGFSPDTTWFNRARLGALRFADYCSASFVSPSGLVMTNHHCGRRERDRREPARREPAR